MRTSPSTQITSIGLHNGRGNGPRIVKPWVLVADERGDQYLAPLEKLPLFFEGYRRQLAR